MIYSSKNCSGLTLLCSIANRLKRISVPAVLQLNEGKLWTIVSHSASYKTKSKGKKRLWLSLQKSDLVWRWISEADWWISEIFKCLSLDSSPLIVLFVPLFISVLFHYKESAYSCSVSQGLWDFTPRCLSSSNAHIYFHKVTVEIRCHRCLRRLDMVLLVLKEVFVTSDFHISQQCCGESYTWCNQRGGKTSFQRKL